MSKDKKPSVYSRLFEIMAQDKSSWIVVIIFLMVSAILYAIGPTFLGNVTNSIVNGLGGSGIDWSQFWFWTWICIALYVGQFLTRWIAGFISAKTTAKVAFALRSEIEKKLWKLPLNYYDTHQRGDIMSRVTNDIDNVQDTLNSTGSDLVYYLLMVVCMIIMMLFLDWTLTLITVLQVPLSMWLVARLSKMVRPKYKQQFDHLGTINSNIEQSFNGHNVIKAYGLEKSFLEKFQKQNTELYTATLHATVLSNMIQPISRVFTNLNYVIVALVGAFRVVSGTMSLGEVQAFIQYSRNFSTPFMQLAQMFSTLQSGMASLERIYDLLESEDELAEKEDALKEHRLNGQIDFKDVFFSYVPERKLIENMNLSIQPGQTVAIVGGTGAGKTTLVNLIERFYEINSGQILLDGEYDLHDLSRNALRQNIGMVLQDTWLFDGTIYENIVYGLPENRKITREEFLEATKATFVDDFVRKLPDGYLTRISNEDSLLSAGQKQLITIARAFLAKPNILILDEATSSVDTRTEALIQEAINRLKENRTSFVIAHRLSTIRGADIILVMENGHIAEQGNHDELMKQNGAYTALYNAQFAG